MKFQIARVFYNIL